MAHASMVIGRLNRRIPAGGRAGRFRRPEGPPAGARGDPLTEPDAGSAAVTVEDGGIAAYDSRFRFTYDFEKCAHDMSTTNRIGLS